MDKTIEQAARWYLKNGIVPLAQNGKKPLKDGYNRLSINDPLVYRQGWKSATGIGILLGERSGNIAAVDIDDCEFARAVFAVFVRGHRPFRWVWTPSGHAHFLFREVEPSFGGPRTAMWEGREIRVDLKSNFHGRDGQVVGASLTSPPTPGYTLATPDGPFVPQEGLQKVWEAICLATGAVPVVREVANEPWKEFVGNGEKNNSLYSEARQCALARMPFETAIEILKIRTEIHYARKIDQKEFQDTVRGAYRRFWKGTSVAENPRYRR